MNVRVHGGRPDPISMLLLLHQHRQMSFEGMATPDRSAEHAAALAAHGRSPADVVLFDYELDIELAPSE